MLGRWSAGGTLTLLVDSEPRLARALMYIEHNSVMPHFAFNGQTPDETYFATARPARRRWPRHISAMHLSRHATIVY
jgi:hypothetical protein